MPVERSQGRLRPLVPRADELPSGVQAEVHAASTGERTPDGRFAPGASTTQRQGGLSRRGQSRLAGRLALGESFAVVCTYDGQASQNMAAKHAVYRALRETELRDDPTNQRARQYLAGLDARGAR